MIELTRLNGNCLIVSCDLIKHVEAAPDTVLTLITGEKLVVLESCTQVQELAFEYRAEILRRAWPGASIPLTAKIAYDAAERVARQQQ